jgi:hypothetical protein
MKRAASPEAHPAAGRRSVPISNEHRLVVADALGTTIKSTSMTSWRCPLAWRRRATAAGRRCDVYIRPAIVACLELCCSPSRGFQSGTGSLWLQPGGPGPRLRNVNAAAGALTGYRHADRRLGIAVGRAGCADTRTQIVQLSRSLADDGGVLQVPAGLLDDPGTAFWFSEACASGL